MGMEQETLIYVEENDREEAKILTQGLLNKDVRNRAYINALGAELGLKYLALENINNSKTYNLHNVHKILEEFDISDIMLSNIHIDVRVVFDENQIFIPKSHFEYDITPDIYLIFLLAEDSSHVKFLGFFEPKLINKNNHNADYYFIEKEKLTSPLNLKAYVDAFKGNRTQTLSDAINDSAETLMISVVDQNASKEEMKELLKYLTQSSKLRDRFIEFENFEILSFKAERSPEVTVPEEIEKNNIIDATVDDIITPQTEAAEESENVAEAFAEADKNLQVSEASDIVTGAEAASAALLSDTALAETSVETVAEAANDIADDVTEMFTNSSLSDSTDVSASANDNVEDIITNNFVSEPESVAETQQTENGAVIDELSGSEEISHDFEVGNPDDFFGDMNFDEPSLEDINSDSQETSDAITSSDLNSDSESVDFSSMEQSFNPVQEDTDSVNEMEVLDISNVTAVPNDLDRNISETIEFNNIELSHEKPCFNELNAEETVPMLNMNDFSPLEPLPMEEVKAESYDMDSLSITDNMLPMPKLDMSEPALEPVDMEDFNNLNSVSNADAKPEAVKQDDSTEDVSSELDSIPDFNAESMDLDSALGEPEALSEDRHDSQAEMPQESHSIEDIQNLSVDDIVEQPFEDDSTESSVTDFESLAAVDELENVEAQSQDIPSIDEVAEAEVSGDVNQIPELGDEIVTPDIDALSDNIDEPGEIEQSAQSENGDSDLTMLFAEGQGDGGPQPENFDTLNSELTKIPSIYQHTQKLPVKMIAVAAVAALLVVGGVAGFSMKNKNSAAESEPLAQSVPEEAAPPVPVADNTNILANTPEVQTLPAAQKEPVNVKKDEKEIKAEAKDKPVNPSGSYIAVTKLSWEVPDYLSYSDNIKKYLQTAGKSIKLTLSSDLLLVTEYAYSNQMKVDLKLSSDGTLKDSKIVKSSGSDQIDKIVLQTVKDTLNVIKPAAGEVPTPDFHLALIINF